MARVFITGTADGLGLAAARSLVEQGHEVVGHARSPERADDNLRLLPGLAMVLVGDLASQEAVERVAAQANNLGRFDAVIHNAGVGYREQERIATPEGHSHVLAINVLAPYLLTAFMERPDRLVYLSSGMLDAGMASVDDLDWTRRGWDGSQAYSDSKLYDATLAAAIARLWPEVLSNSVDPGWVPTRMGGAGAPDDLAQGHLTQTWLAVSDDPAARVSGRHFFHQREREVKPVVQSAAWQDTLLGALSELTGVKLPEAPV